MRCESYEQEAVYKALVQGVELLGGTGAFVCPGEKILLKPNMLAGRQPHLAVTTHPAVFEAAVRVFREGGALLSYGDSPGYENAKTVARKTGLGDAAHRLGVPAADFETPVLVSREDIPGIPGGKAVFPLARGALEADGIISLPKMKTHGLTRITGAVKNQLGCVTGFEKARLHFLYPNPRRFASRLAAITKILSPRLYIMDGISAMEGEGPAGGNPVGMNIILLSRDPVALDTVFCRLIDLSPAFVPTIKAAQDMGLGTSDEGSIKLAGEPPENFVKPDFDVVRRPVSGDTVFRLPSILRNRLIPRPVIDKALCKKCGVCIRACPVEPRKAVNFPHGKNRFPVYAYGLCIRCFCCQEMCPHKAIHVKTPLSGRAFAGFLSALRKKA
ncbi:MAG: DUF362 domain-containing protein [Spirochaetales bacterium]|nr:DUF362 domain-containing protein [Spirochaetales bacterium]